MCPYSFLFIQTRVATYISRRGDHRRVRWTISEKDRGCALDDEGNVIDGITREAPSRDVRQRFGFQRQVVAELSAEMIVNSSERLVGGASEWSRAHGDRSCVAYGAAAWISLRSFDKWVNDGRLL